MATGRVAANQLKASPYRWRWKEYNTYLERIASIAAKADVSPIEFADRQSILLALPKIARVPCANCETKLQVAIKAGEGKTTLGDLNLETTMMKNYFSWAGGKTPTAKAEDDLPAPGSAATASRREPSGRCGR